MIAGDQAESPSRPDHTEFWGTILGLLLFLAIVAGFIGLLDALRPERFPVPPPVQSDCVREAHDTVVCYDAEGRVIR